MRWMRISVSLMSILALAVGSRAEHNRLLPRPQQVRYGSGRLPVRGLSIRFASAPSAEDRFAAETLARFLSDRAEGPIPVSEERGSDRAIVLHRTVAVDPLPVFGESPGPDSREAYELKVTATGGELRAKSSAGLFYGVQTPG